MNANEMRAFFGLLELPARQSPCRFGNPWAFEEYAPAENLGLDFTVFTKQPGARNSRRMKHLEPKAILQTNPHAAQLTKRHE